MTRQVTQEEFDKIECNRCGQCCEGFWLSSPLALATHLESITDPKYWDWLNHIEPTGKVSDDFSANTLFDGLHRTQYRCTYFKRDTNGLGMCTNYKNRPDVCKEFPYGKPTTGFVGCSWDVEIVEV